MPVLLSRDEGPERSAVTSTGGAARCWLMSESRPTTHPNSESGNPTVPGELSPDSEGGR